jgi:thioredoxin reductase
VFIEAGAVPPGTLIRNTGIETDRGGYIAIDEKGETNVSGFYAAGDVTTGSNGLRQIVTAASEGAIAAASIYGELKKGN